MVGSGALPCEVEKIGSAKARTFAVEPVVPHAVDPAYACVFVDDTILSGPTALVVVRGVVADGMTGAVVGLSYWIEVGYALRVLA